MSANGRPSSRALTNLVPSSSEWVAQKPRIRGLWLDQGMTAWQVRDEMAAEHGFYASEQQYKNHFRTWGYTKYAKRQRPSKKRSQRDKRQPATTDLSQAISANANQLIIVQFIPDTTSSRKDQGPKGTERISPLPTALGRQLSEPTYAYSQAGNSGSLPALDVEITCLWWRQNLKTYVSAIHPWKPNEVDIVALVKRYDSSSQYPDELAHLWMFESLELFETGTLPLFTYAIMMVKDVLLSGIVHSFIILGRRLLELMDNGLASQASKLAKLMVNTSASLSDPLLRSLHSITMAFQPLTGRGPHAFRTALAKFEQVAVDVVLEHLGIHDYANDESDLIVGLDIYHLLARDEPQSPDRCAALARAQQDYHILCRSSVKASDGSKRVRRNAVIDLAGA